MTIANIVRNFFGQQFNDDANKKNIPKTFIRITFIEPKMKTSFVKYISLIIFVFIYLNFTELIYSIFLEGVKLLKKSN